MKKMLAKAIEIAVEAHKGQFDRGGNPYILHPMWVMNEVKHLSTEHMIVAILHDVVEDTDVTIDDLKLAGFDLHITVAIGLLDFRKVDYMTRIITISDYSNTKSDYNSLIGKLARDVKMADLKHNSDITRLKGIKPKDLERMAKYHEAYLILKG